MSSDSADLGSSPAQERTPERAQDRVQDRIVWIDCEMTGLSLERDALIEVAALVTDADLNVLGTGVDVVVRPPEGAVEAMDPVVVAMHTASGLLAELPEGRTMEEAEQAVLDYVRQWVPEPRKAPLAGSSVHTDRAFLARDMPVLVDHLHYRLIDVSSLKELARRWFPRVYYNTPKKHGGHRALADIRESIQELKYYREVLFVRDPGPDSETARAAGGRLELRPEATGPE
ncbi:oligoribonuclease [Kineococcus xinjiangensis]|uniref:Oligoribonuclease n=1 Tax=Kineococcus xinjiangensis TaxID=512762 RepID=A0A2S6ICP9_9ACTN|nr:oligoribonuclease [Kineococcus xinjiangensis]PPK91979.1 oligoribonuclease [Kineococcus xinjiangensis]